MWLRRGFFGWLFPAAVLLPIWLLIGWAIFSASGWAFLGVLFIAGPAVLIGELVVALLIRARPTVRARRAVSWWDVLGIAVWHVLVIAFGCYPQAVFVPVLILAVAAFLGTFWSSVAQLVGELRLAAGRYTSAAAGPGSTGPEVIVVTETPRSSTAP